jgi:hypothetical protein
LKVDFAVITPETVCIKGGHFHGNDFPGFRQSLQGTNHHIDRQKNNQRQDQAYGKYLFSYTKLHGRVLVEKGVRNHQQIWKCFFHEMYAGKETVIISGF